MQETNEATVDATLHLGWREQVFFLLPLAAAQIHGQHEVLGNSNVFVDSVVFCGAWLRAQPQGTFLSFARECCTCLLSVVASSCSFVLALEICLVVNIKTPAIEPKKNMLCKNGLSLDCARILVDACL